MAAAMNPGTRGAVPVARITEHEANREGTISEKAAAVVDGVKQRVGTEAEAQVDRAEYAHSTAEAVNPVDRDGSVMHNMIGGAISFGLALMIIVLMALVTGYFATEVPSDGAFNESIDTAVDIGGTGFIIFSVTLLAVPVVALIGYFMRSGLGGFIGGGGGGMGR